MSDFDLIVLIEVVLVFGGVLLFAWWQLYDLARKIARPKKNGPYSDIGDENIFKRNKKPSIPLLRSCRNLKTSLTLNIESETFIHKDPSNQQKSWLFLQP